MNSYETLTEALIQLRKEGYTEDFNLMENYIECRDGRHKLFHDDFMIDKFFRFEGMTDPDDEAILYAISSPKYNIKGVLVNGYGIYSENIANELADKLKITG